MLPTKTRKNEIIEGTLLHQSQQWSGCMEFQSRFEKRLFNWCLNVSCFQDDSLAIRQHQSRFCRKELDQWTRYSKLADREPHICRTREAGLSLSPRNAAGEETETKEKKGCVGLYGQCSTFTQIMSIIAILM